MGACGGTASAVLGPRSDSRRPPSRLLYLCASCLAHAGIFAGLLVRGPGEADTLPQPLYARGDASAEVTVTFSAPRRVTPEHEEPLFAPAPLSEPADMPPLLAEEAELLDAEMPSDLSPSKAFHGPPSIPDRLFPSAATVVVAFPVRPRETSAGTRGVSRGAEALDLPAPRYPEACRRRGQEGEVVLEVEVLADGRAREVRVLERARYEQLTEAAIDAARRARFAPALRDGRAVTASVVIPFRFVLR